MNAFVIRDSLGGYAVRDVVDGWIFSLDPTMAYRFESARLAALTIMANLRGVGTLRVEEVPPAVETVKGGV